MKPLEYPNSKAPFTSYVDTFRAHALAHPDRPALVFLEDGELESASLTYGQLDERARALAGRLQGLELRGERALLLFPSGLEFAIAFLGCLYAGVVAVPAPAPDPGRLERLMLRLQVLAADSGARVILTSASAPFLSDPPAHSAVLSGMRQLAVGLDGPEPGEAWSGAGCTAATPAFLQYTSGSTGDPRGVVVTHGNLVFNERLIQAAFGYDEHSTLVGWLPLFHDMGLIGTLLLPLFNGALGVLMPPAAFLARPARWLEAISRYRAQISGGPDFAYALCARKVHPGELERMDLSSWRVAFNGAEPVRHQTLERFCERFGPVGFRRQSFYPCYGLAEATLMVTGGDRDRSPATLEVEARALEDHRLEISCPAEVLDGAQASPVYSPSARARGTGDSTIPGHDAHGPDAPGQDTHCPDEGSLKRSVRQETAGRWLVSSGHSWLEQEVVIVDPETRRGLPDHQVGEIWVRGPGVARGYWNRPEESSSTFQAERADNGQGPYLRTGDLGAFHEGELYVVGRLKDLIILRGRNLHPADLEQAIEACHPSLRPGGSAAFSIEDEGEERLVVAVEVDPNAEAARLEAVELSVREAVALKFDVRVHAVAMVPPHGLPRTSSGKLRRQACRRAYLEGAWSRGGRSSSHTSSARLPPTSLELLLLEEVARALQAPPRSLSPDVSLAALGLDSLSGLELRDRLEALLGIEVPLELLTGELTLNGLESRLSAIPHREGRAQGHLNAQGAAPGGSRPAGPDEARREEGKAAKPGLGNGNALSPHLLPALRNRLADYEARWQQGIPTAGGSAHSDAISLMSNDYLSISGDPRIVAAQIAALQGEPRDVFMSGVFLDENSPQRGLERELAAYFGAEDAALCQSGWSANDGLLQALVDPQTPVYLDVMAHMSMWQGVRNAGGIPRPFRHNRPESLEALIRRHGPGIVLVDSVYSAHGDLCRLGDFVEVAERHGCLLVVDEAHGAGVFGQHGEGLAVAQGVSDRIPLRTISLSKAFVSRAGLVVGSTRWINYFRHTSRPSIFSSAVTAHEIAGFRATLEVIRQDDWRRARLLTNSARLRQSLLELGFSLPDTGSQIISLEGGPEARTVAMRQALERRGVLGAVFCAPATPVNRSLVRLSINAGLSDEQLARVIEACTAVRDELSLWKSVVGNQPNREVLDLSGLSSSRSI